MRRVPGTRRALPVAVALLSLVVALVLGAVPVSAAEPDPSTSGVATDRIPELARESLPGIEQLTGDYCPELPPVWVVAQVQAESGWDPDLRTGGAAGLFQLSERTWVAAGGDPWPDPDLTDPEAHLRIAVPWMCSTLRAVAGHLATNAKPVSVLDAMLVCHIAGCRRVTGSRSGVPQAGEADCSRACSAAIGRYLDVVHRNLETYSAGGGRPGTNGSPAAPRGVQRLAGPAAPTVSSPAPAWTGGRTPCKPPDPTRPDDGCLTGAARHGLRAAERVFGGLDGGPVIKKAGCWDAHAWNPTSDHPKGRACDLFPGPAGTFPKGDALDHGWRIAHWFEANAGPLKVKYLIWQGRYWDSSVRADGSGWGRRYTGGGVYDTKDPTGGHYDHVHVSFAE
ncbi:MAG: lytic transglycosylase domain-containing protein [Actinomycetota bacterium]|nr:lytic transglycosylase domain-containing protein [Actinomycetota bacterium]